MSDFLKELNSTLTNHKSKLSYKGSQVDSYIIICPDNLDKRMILNHCSITFPDFQPVDIYHNKDITQNMYKGQHVVMPYNIFRFDLYQKIKDKTFTFINL